MNVAWLERAYIVGPFYCLCLNKKQYRKALKELKIKHSDAPSYLHSAGCDASAHHFEKPDGKLATVVCLGRYKDRKESEIYGLLIHEAVHIWQNFCESVGEKKPSDEFEAYSVQVISQRLIESFQEQKK